MEHHYFNRIITTGALLVILLSSSTLHAICKWEDKNGVYHMTDDRSQAPRNAKCDSEPTLDPDPTPTESKKSSCDFEPQIPSNRVSLGEYMCHWLMFDPGSISLGAVSRSAGKLTKLNISVTVTDIFGTESYLQSEAVYDVKCTALNSGDGSGIQLLYNIRGTVGMTYKQQALLRKLACERSKFH